MKHTNTFFIHLFLFTFLFKAPAQNIVLDPDFGSSGKVVTTFAEDIYFGLDVAIQPDGKIILVGFRTNPGIYMHAASYRFNPDGTLDNTFAGGSNTGLWGSSDQIRAIALQSDGKIIVAGSLKSSVNPSYDFAIARLLPNGGFDGSFNGTGKITSSFYSNFTSKESLYGVAIQPDGKIVAVGGVSSNSTEYSFAVLRYNASGPTVNVTKKQFSVAGKVSAEAFTVAIQPDGKIVVAGRAGANYPFGDFAMIRLNSDLSLDQTFGTEGSVFTDLNGNSSITKILLQPDGKILAGGKSGDNIYTLARYNPDGSLDDSFGIKGIQVTDIPSGSYGPVALSLLANGKFLMSGSITAGAMSHDFLLAQFNNDGSLDTNFGVQGKIVTDFSGSDDFASAIAIQSDGKIITAGYSGYDEDTNFALARYIPTLNVGALDLYGFVDQTLVYPNPMDQSSTLEYTLHQEEIITIQLLDSEGRKIKDLLSAQKEEAGNYQHHIALPNGLPSGYYAILLSTANGRNLNIKVIVTNK